MNVLLKLVYALQLAVLVGSQGVKVENLQLTADSPVHCETIIQDSTFEGDCCALNVTQGNGCVLNVINGRCVIKGQYWTLDFTSTLKRGGVQCPGSEFVVGTTQFPTQAPLSSASTLHAVAAAAVVLSATLVMAF